ncbi:universal stress protein [Bacillus sp. FJAT-45350]|uniref:universal stress protein n=1 Tax=Bacillus sp. FJAT-45350 TaxID=2011014 RepID=UPI000BB7C8C6|nr:universal stress protein [Bacillus sp. FJAT-45350]
MFNKVVIAADGSKHSERAAEKAIFLVKGNDQAVIEVIYVVDGSTSKSDVLHNTDSYQIAEQRKEKIKGVLELLHDAQVEYKVTVLHGEPGPAIVEYANTNGVDCVVIGSRGLNKLQEMVLGSVSHKVAKRVQCPVMLVK